MEVILLEKIANLGGVGERVKVKSGYARNYLIPYSKAVVANADNIQLFETQRAELEKRAQEALEKAQARSAELAAVTVTIVARASDEGKLFGSLGPRDIAKAATDAGALLEKSEVLMPEGPIRLVGEYIVSVQFHSDVLGELKVVIEAEKNH